MTIEAVEEETVAVNLAVDQEMALSETDRVQEGTFRKNLHWDRQKIYFFIFSEHSTDGSEKGFHNKGPRTSSRNDHGNKFQKNYDKPRNQNSFQPSNDDSWNVSAVSSSIDAAPVTATYGSSHVVGTEANVTMSWFHNPSHFYLQLVDSQVSIHSY